MTSDDLLVLVAGLTAEFTLSDLREQTPAAKKRFGLLDDHEFSLLVRYMSGEALDEPTVVGMSTGADKYFAARSRSEATDAEIEAVLAADDAHLRDDVEHVPGVTVSEGVTLL